MKSVSSFSSIDIQTGSRSFHGIEEILKKQCFYDVGWCFRDLHFGLISLNDRSGRKSSRYC